MTPVFDTPIKTNDQSINRVLAAGFPVALVFLRGTATDSLGQSMDRLAHMYAGRLLVVQMQIGDNPESTRRFEVNHPPSLVTLQDGKVRSRAESIYDSDLEAHVAYLLGEGPEPAPKSANGGINGKKKSPGKTTHSPEFKNSGPSPAGNPINVSDANFNQQVLHSLLPVLVDFWAPWCGPCRMTEPILEKLASETVGRLVVAKLNVDENPQTAGSYAVRSIPTMMLMKNGKIIDQWVGALPEPVLRQRLAHVLN